MTDSASSFRALPTRLRWLGLAVIGLIVLFYRPLYDLARYSLHSELYSHVLLIPCVSAYLAWTLKRNLPAIGPPDWVIAAGAAVVGSIALAAYWWVGPGGDESTPDNQLAAATLAFLAFFYALSAGLLGRALVRALVFPLGFLLFMIPLPVPVLNQIESYLQEGSAAAARALFSLAGSTYYYSDLHFQLPGITLEVAPECSGIRSSLALLITSVVVGFLFLRSPARRALLTLAVIPLGLIRNGFRIFTIGELCVRIGPEMINSYIHRHGGPYFFAASLVPLFLLLFYFVRQERRGPAGPQPK